MASGEDPQNTERSSSGLASRLWRSRRFARLRHRATRLRRTVGIFTRTHGQLVRLSGGRMHRSFLFAGGLPILVITTTGRRSGKSRTTPLAFIRFEDGFAVIASNAGSDHAPAWWLNLQADPRATVFVDRRSRSVSARQATAQEDRNLWATIAELNPGFDEYRALTARQLPIVILEPTQDHPLGSTLCHPLDGVG